MPRKTAHKWCVRCEEVRAQVGAYTGYYVLSSKSKSGPKPQKPNPQVKGTLPARGFCMDCFLRHARKQGWDDTEMRKLRATLRGAGLEKANADQ